MIRHSLKSLTLIFCAFVFSVVGQGICSRFRPVAGRCDMNAPALEQAKCFLRPVKKFANLDPPLTSVPAPLDTLIGQLTDARVSLVNLRAFLTNNNIRESDIGGALSVRLTRARYFVIHDTSDFLDGRTEFPANINAETFSPNNVARRSATKICHVYVNRLGKSATAVPFESTTPPSGTKFGSCHSSQRRAFLHIENVQPRIRDRSVSFSNDALAPNPGFTDEQLERLALLYIAASVRSGRWLIPAYHSPIDLGYPNRHDDPQNFDLGRWSEKLNSLISQINSGSPSGAGNSDTVRAESSSAVTDDTFNLPQPTALSDPRRLWATHYYVFGDVRSVPQGKPLLNMSGVRLGPLLATRDWCLGAIEGTIRVVETDGRAKVFNFAGRGSRVQVDCSGVIHNPSINLRAIGSSRYSKSRGPFGDGVQGMILVPYRTIAVDKTSIPFGSVVYIPAARGKEIRLPNGQSASHDGYFFAADTGGAIRGNHIDVFGGVFTGNPFPNFIKSVDTQTFDAFIISDQEIMQTLRRAHTP